MQQVTDFISKRITEKLRNISDLFKPQRSNENYLLVHCIQKNLKNMFKREKKN